MSEKSQTPEISPGHIGELKFDPRNARKHNPKNVGMIERSLQETGVGRSIVTTRDGTIIAGNATIEAAGAAGIEDAIVVRTRGDKVIVHVREDLADGDTRATLLGLYDNRTAELADWDVDVLTDMQAEFGGLPSFEHIFSDNDMRRLMGAPDREPAADVLEDIQYRIVVECDDENHQVELMEKFAELGLSFKPLMS
jgi:hypothetical protein